MPQPRRQPTRPALEIDTTLRPGLLVSLKTSIVGNIDYNKQTIEPTHLDADGKQKAKWETERVIEDPTEMEAAWAARAKARGTITAICSQSDFGLMVPEADAGKLAETIATARKFADDFNRTSRITKVRIYVITGRIAQDDVEAIRAINSEIRGLLDTMKQGVKDLDVTVIRKAATKLKSVGAMLSDDAAERVKKAFETGREIAKKIVKAGEGAAVEIDRAALRHITEARTAFLDLSEPGEIAAPAEEGRVLDLPPTPLEEAIARSGT